MLERMYASFAEIDDTRSRIMYFSKPESPIIPQKNKVMDGLINLTQTTIIAILGNSTIHEYLTIIIIVEKVVAIAMIQYRSKGIELS